MVLYIFRPPLTNSPILQHRVGLHEPGMIRAISSEGNVQSQCAVLLDQYHNRLLSCPLLVVLSAALSRQWLYSYLSTYRRHDQDVE